MSDLPDVFNGQTIAWSGVDDTTPPGCTLVSANILGVFTTYLVRDGIVLGRLETSVISGRSGATYLGSGLKGGRWLGSVGFSETAFDLIIKADAAGEGQR